MKIISIDQVKINDIIYNASCYVRNYYKYKIIDNEGYSHTYKGLRYRIYNSLVCGKSKIITEGRTWKENEERIFISHAGTVLNYYEDLGKIATNETLSEQPLLLGMDLKKSDLFTTVESAILWIDERILELKKELK